MSDIQIQLFVLLCLNLGYLIALTMDQWITYHD